VLDTLPLSQLVRQALRQALAFSLSLSLWGDRASHAIRAVIHWLSLHTGVPALVVAAVLVVIGYRVLKRSARFAVEVALVAAVLVMASQLGWIRW
jgi:hypothetical protein